MLNKHNFCNFIPSFKKNPCSMSFVGGGVMMEAFTEGLDENTAASKLDTFLRVWMRDRSVASVN